MRGRWPAMVRLAYALTGDQGHAEDVAQAAFARAYASWPKVRRTENPEGYVRRIVINENRNRFRKHRVTEELTGAPPEPGPGAGPGAGPGLGLGDATSQYDERSVLMTALRRPGPRQRAGVA